MAMFDTFPPSSRTAGKAGMAEKIWGIGCPAAPCSVTPLWTLISAISGAAWVP
jgi:hypothetical protein